MDFKLGGLVTINYNADLPNEYLGELAFIDYIVPHTGIITVSLFEGIFEPLERDEDYKPIQLLVCYDEISPWP